MLEAFCFADTKGLKSSYHVSSYAMHGQWI